MADKAKVYARRQDIEQCWATSTCQQLTLVTPHHLLEEMIEMGDEYFSHAYQSFDNGDIIIVTDAAMQRAMFLVENVNLLTHRVQISLIERQIVRPCTGDVDGLTVRWRGERGGKWCVVNALGESISMDHEDERAAEGALEAMRREPVPEPERSPESKPMAKKPAKKAT